MVSHQKKQPPISKCANCGRVFFDYAGFNWNFNEPQYQPQTLCSECRKQAD
jgi:uncharacterized OB-fold protein